jgi:DNA-binding IclR family transcriptional regulator
LRIVSDVALVPAREKRLISERTARSLTVEKALRLLDTVAAEGSPVSLLALSRAAGIDKTTTHRLATSLTRYGLLRFDPNERAYSLGLRLIDLGQRAIGQLHIAREARPYLEQLGALSGEAVNLGVYDEGQVVFIEQVASPQPVVIRARAGSRIPAHCTGIGKVLLAYGPAEWKRRVLKHGLPPLTPNTISEPAEFTEHLTRVRRLGYAFDDEEHRLGVRCVASPVRDHTGLAIAAISISGPAFRLSRERLNELVEPLRQSAEELSALLGYHANIAPPHDARNGAT